MLRRAPIFAACLVLIAFTTPVAAQSNYPWCSNFADGFGGTNCGFVSYEQCMATVRGSGGFCNKNDMYRPEGADAPAAHRPHKAASRKSS